jgi:hypothetical protein
MTLHGRHSLISGQTPRSSGIATKLSRWSVRPHSRPRLGSTKHASLVEWALAREHQSPEANRIQQGCCISRSSGPNSPYPGGVPSSAAGSARAINSSSAPNAQASPSSPSDPNAPSQTGTVNSARRQRPRAPLAQHINKPLRRHEWVSSSRLWTPAQLSRERQEFFDTRVTGRQEIWQTIRAALEVLWEAESQVRAGAGVGDPEGIQPEVQPDNVAEDRSVALATAQSILTAAEITLPTGDFAQGAYDNLGNYYPVPEPVVSDPVNIAVDGDPKAAVGAADADLDDSKAVLVADEEDGVEDGVAEARREEKGKAVVNKENQVRIRARLSEGGNDVVVTVDRAETVRNIARRVGEIAKVSLRRLSHLAEGKPYRAARLTEDYSFRPTRRSG